MMKNNFKLFSSSLQNWSEGLPVEAPTYLKVKKMLGSDWNKRNEIFGEINSLNITFTYYQLASNAVLAGCTNNLWPIFKTTIECLMDSKFNIETVITTVHSQSPLVLISGEAARDLNIEGGRGSIGPGNKSALVLGRAVYLFLRNICNAKPETLDASTFGSLGKISFCFAENITLSPWDEFHIRQGFQKNQSTITVFASQFPHEIVEMGEKNIQSLLDGLIYTLKNPWTYNAFYNQDVWLIISPEHANKLELAGYSIEKIKQYLFENTYFKPKELINHGLYGFIDNKIINDGKYLFKNPDNLKIVVSGGKPGGYSLVCFGSGISITKVINR